MRKRVLKLKSLALAAVLTFTSIPINGLAFEGHDSLLAGTYQGSANGYGGKLTVEVTVGENDNLTSIEVISHNETVEDGFFEDGCMVIDRILDAQSTDVDTVSGATRTSQAIINAVNDALTKAVPGFSGGTGTEADPYTISNASGLEYLQQEVAGGNTFEGKYIALAQNITLSGEWTPIGSANAPFAGTFNGKNYTISGLTITGSQAYAGLFGYAASGADFKNINLTNVSIQTTEVASLAYVGGIVAFMKNDGTGATNSNIDNCFVSGEISVATANQVAMVGGLTGMSNQYAAISNNIVDAAITVNTGSKIANVGGLVGMASVKPIIINNYADAQVTVSSSNTNSNAGGLCGTLNGIVYNNLVVGSAVTESGCAGVVAGNQGASCYIANTYYVGETLFGKATGQTDTETVTAKTNEEVNSADFAKLLHDNLTMDALAVMAEKTEAAAVAGCEDFDALLTRVNPAAGKRFYDWTYAQEKVTLSTAIWASDTVDAGIFAGGTGTAEDPYLISTEEQLRAFALSLTANLDYAGVYIKLNNDIAVSEEAWTPIGLGEYAFQGDFDGNGFGITGIKIGSESTPYQDSYYDAELKTGGTYYGLFGALGRYSNVHDLTVDVDIYVQSNVSVYVGGIAGISDRSVIDEVTVNGTVWGKSGMVSAAANHFSGGVAGMVYRSTITNCISHANVYGEAVGAVGEAGGIAGISNRALVANCVADGLILGTADRVAEGMSALGGICGVNAGQIVNCLSNSELYSLTYSQYVGAFAGWVTGIGELYCNRFNLDAQQKIENQIINPAISVGWLVGPGINDEGEPYTGSIEYQSNGYQSEEVTAEKLAEMMNGTFEAFPVETDVTLNQWIVEDGKVIPAGEKTSVTYVEPDIDEPVIEEDKISGTFFGRSGDELLVIKMTTVNSVITGIEIVKNDTGVNLDEYITNVVENNGIDKLPATESGDEIWVKAAVVAALEKMQNNDTTGYGKVDPSIFAGGNGTKENPYKIATTEQFVAFATSINVDENYEDTYVELTADIQLTGEWTPAGGDAHHPFKGYLNGNGYSIKGLVIGSAESPKEMIFAGIFSYIEGGSVSNLTIDTPSIHIKDTYTNRIYAGALAAFVDQRDDADSYIDNCVVKNAGISVHSAAGAGYAGGLAGCVQYGIITNSQVDAVINGVSDNSWSYAGVLTGIMARVGVVNNMVTGSVTASAPLNKSAMGGLAGFHSGVSYNNVADVELVSAGTTNDVGALGGRNTGIGLMLDGYYNNEKTQRAGDTVFEARGVGTIVEGETDGRGEVTGLTGVSAAGLYSTETAALLNANISAQNASYAKVVSLLSSSWGVTVSSDIVLNEWTVKDGKLVFAEEETDNGSDKETDKVPEDEKTSQTEKPTVTKPNAPKNIKAVAVNYKTVRLTWSKVSGAAGYAVYKYDAKTKKYKLIGRTSKQTYTEKNVKTGANNIYKVKAYKTVDGKTYYSAKYSKTAKVKTVLKNTKVAVKNRASKRAAVTWKKVAGANGYEVYRAAKKNGKYKKVKTITKGSTVKFVNKSLKKGKTYYYKVRAYRIVNGNKVYSSFSNVKGVKIRK